jgi:hypothetical protein
MKELKNVFPSPILKEFYKIVLDPYSLVILQEIAK